MELSKKRKNFLENYEIFKRLKKNIIGTILNAIISRLDPILRRSAGIFEFSSDERCIIRISIHTSNRTVRLRDGTRIAKGDLFGDIHWWNEHMPDYRGKGKGLRSANAFKRNLLISFRQLAGFVRSAPEYRRVKDRIRERRIQLIGYSECREVLLCSGFS